MKMGKRGAVASLMILALAVPAAVIAQQPAAPAATKEKSVLTSEREKIGYAIGVDVASSFEPIASEVDVAALRRAVENAFAGGQPLLSQEEAQKTDQALRMALDLVVQDDPSRVVCSELVYRGYAEAVTRPANALRLPITHRASQSTPLPKIDFIALAMECLEDYQRANPKGALRAATPAELPDLLAQARSTLGIGGLQASGTGDIAPNPKTVLPADLEFSGGLRKLGRLPLAA